MIDPTTPATLYAQLRFTWYFYTISPRVEEHDREHWKSAVAGMTCQRSGDAVYYSDVPRCD